MIADVWHIADVDPVLIEHRAALCALRETLAHLKTLFDEDDSSFSSPSQEPSSAFLDARPMSSAR